MSEQRKASDILLELEKEVRLLKQIVSVQDIILKTLLGNSNKTNAILGALVGSLTPAQQQIVNQQLNPTNPNIIPASSLPQLEVETDFKGQRRAQSSIVPSTKASNSDIEFKDYLAQRKDSKNNEKLVKQPELSAEKKLPVTQRLLDGNAKDIFMAEINITSLNGEFALKTKTNAQGKWQAQLSPGKYLVKVSKTDSISKKKYETQQEIVIQNSNIAIVLPNIILNRE